MSREIMQQALHHLAALADDLRRIPSDIAQTLAALETEISNYEKPLPPVDIGVDVTPEGTHVVACYNRPDAVQEMFYSQFHPLAKLEQSNYSDIVSDGGLDPRNKCVKNEWLSLRNQLRKIKMTEDKIQKLIQDLMGFMTEDEYTELDKALYRAIVELRRKQND